MDGEATLPRAPVIGDTDRDLPTADITPDALLIGFEEDEPSRCRFDPGIRPFHFPGGEVNL